MSFENESSDLRPTPPIRTTKATLDALEEIYKRSRPHPPCQQLPNLEDETTAACPDSIKAIWKIPQCFLIPRYSYNNSKCKPTTSSPTPRLVLPGLYPSELLRQPVSQDKSTPSQVQDNDVCTVAAEQWYLKGRDEYRPPTSPSPPMVQNVPTTSTGNSRLRGRLAIGLALVSVRERVDIETWLEGVEQIRENGRDVAKFYEILSLGMQVRTESRDV